MTYVLEDNACAMFLFSIVYILNKTENAVGYFVLEENVPKDVKKLLASMALRN